MNPASLEALVSSQRAYFRSGQTLPLENRIQALRSLQQVLSELEPRIYEALQADLGKSAPESYMCELGMVKSELTYMIKHIRRLAKDRRVPTPLAQFAARSFVTPSPLGVTLIMSPWNYPLMLALDPLVDALAAGNTAILKPSAYAPRTSQILEEIVRQAFPPQLVALVTGGREENQQLLQQKFDFIFFTGSAAVGKEVLKAAAPNLTPVALELGGKSPCIVDETADLKLAARRIVFGKFLNCGQTCVAPDYIVCQESVAEPLRAAIQAEITRQFGKDPLQNPNYGKIINEKHFNRLPGLISDGKVCFGGQVQPEEHRISPTLLCPASWQEKAMQEEIFGPILPILTYDSLDEILDLIGNRPHPLALYFFSENKKAIRRVLRCCPFGGGCINDTIIHLATCHMGFGGVGNSGMGAYHGKVGFDTFSHLKSIVDKKTFLDLPMRYQPYTSINEKLIRFFLK